MMIRFNRTLSIFCAVALLICAVSTWAYAEQTPATPSDLTPVEEVPEEETPVTEQPEEEPAESVEVIITKTLGINQSWEGRMKKTKPAVLKLDLSSPCTVYMLVEGQDVWATVEKSDRLTADPTRYLTNSETDQLIYSWEAEAGSYLITLGPVEPNLLAKATVSFMNDEAFATWTAKHETEPEKEVVPEEVPETELEEENEPESETESERNINVDLIWDVPNPKIGDTVHFKANLEGYEGLNYTIQWQYSLDDDTWHDIPNETEAIMDVVVNEINNMYYWRIVVYLEDEQEN